MNIFIDAHHGSLNKHNEELCGDKVEIIRNDDSVIVVLADGLGSGVKANILSTLTSKIIGTMLAKGANIDEAVETISSTLPVCRERGIAYSTFSILQLFNNGESYLVEYDNPSIIRLNKGRHVELEKNIRYISGKRIYESRFKFELGDVFILISDGVVHAGVGQTLNFGWQWQNIRDYMEKTFREDMNVKDYTNLLLSMCSSLYCRKPGDDTTVAAVKIREESCINVMIGPPVDKSLDSFVVKKFISSHGKKVICGGTTAQIVGNVTGKEVVTNLEYVNPAIPPIANMDGIDLVTEGVLTMSRALEYARQYIESTGEMKSTADMNRSDGASRLARLLLKESTSVHFFAGRAINPAHQNPEFPVNLGIKLKLVEDMTQCLRRMGKQVTVEYY